MELCRRAGVPIVRASNRGNASPTSSQRGDGSFRPEGAKSYWRFLIWTRYAHQRVPRWRSPTKNCRRNSRDGAAEGVFCAPEGAACLRH